MARDDDYQYLQKQSDDFDRQISCKKCVCVCGMESYLNMQMSTNLKYTLF